MYEVSSEIYKWADLRELRGADSLRTGGQVRTRGVGRVGAAFHDTAGDGSTYAGQMGGQGVRGVGVHVDGRQLLFGGHGGESEREDEDGRGFHGVSLVGLG